MLGRGRYDFGNYVTVEDLVTLVPHSVYGDIYVDDNSNSVELDVGSYVQITDFDTNGPFNGTMPDHTENHITITDSGIYSVNCHISVHNDSVGKQTINMAVFVNNGFEELANTEAHDTLQGGSGDTVSFSFGGIVTLDAGDTVEVWATTDATTESIVIENITLSMIGMSS